MKSFTLLFLVSALAPALVSAQKGEEFAGYTFQSDVTEHLNLDLDQQTMESLTDDFKWSDAKRIYAEGKNSKKTDGLRNLKGFSTSAGFKMEGEGYFFLYRSYYNDQSDYADRFVTSALDASGDFKGAPNMMRAECANKGSQYQNVWMYIIHEMEDAINDCENNDLDDNDAGVQAWDEAWAFYTGSLVNEDGRGSGVMIYTLAQKRCADYGTCGTDGIAEVNRDILALMTEGMADLQARRCEDVIAKKNKIVRLMTVPLLQGVLRYVEQAKDAPEGNDGKAHGEGWAFSSAVLPLVDHCDGGVASRLVKNFEPSADPPMSDSVDDVANDIYKVLGCLGITCEQMGTGGELPECNDSEEEVKPVPLTLKSAQANVNEGQGTTGETETPGGGSSSGGSGSNNSGGSSDDDGGLSGGAKAGIAIAVIALIVVAGLLAWRFVLKKRSKPPIEPLAEPSGGVMA